MAVNLNNAEVRNMRYTRSEIGSGLGFFLAVLLSACETMDATEENGMDGAAYTDPIVVRVSGSGTYEKADDRKNMRKRLLAMRASKLDAYRALAERIYGTALYGATTVNEMVVSSDRYKTFVDSVIRGARVISVEDIKGAYETTLEVVLEGRFRSCLTNVNYFRYSEECRMPLPQSDPDPAIDAAPTTGMYFLNLNGAGKTN